MGTDDSSFFGPTEEQGFLDWLDWGDRFLSVILLVSQRVSLAVAASGFAVAGANLVGNERTVGMGQLSLGVAGVFAVWFAAVNIAGVRARR